LRMRLFAIGLFMLLAAASLATSITIAQGVGEGDWITKYRIEDVETGQLIMERDFQTGTTSDFASIFEASELKVTFTVDVDISNPSAILKITTSMSHSSIEDRYWQLLSPEYDLLNYNPNQQTIQFNQVSGTLELSCYGRVPTGIVTDTIDGIVLHKPVPFSIISLTSPGGDVLDQIKPDVTDAKIDEYRNLLEQKEDKLESLKGSGVAPGYIEIFEGVVDQAETQADLGFVDQAIALLNLLAVSQEPVSSIMETLFLPIVGVLAVAVVAVGFVFLRTRGKIKYVTAVIEDQIKDLEGLTLRVSKIDRTISSRLESIRDRLKGLIWT
jgi:uncharacterized membrane protein YciS (DUF1049 family)